MAPDGSHVIVGFPDVLSPAFGRENIAVTASDGTGLTVVSAGLDSLSGTLLEIEVSPGYDLRAPLRVRFYGLEYERGAPVSSRPVVLEVAAGVRYQRDVAPFLAARCSNCHGAVAPGGGYRTDSRGALYAFGSDSLDMDRSPNLIPGNDRCQLAVKTSHAGREFRRANLTFFDAEMIRQWILNGDAADPPQVGSSGSIVGQTQDFTHVRVVFSADPDPAEATLPGQYRLVDLDSPGTEYTPVEALLDSSRGATITLHFPQQKMYHRYRISTGRFHDRFGDLLFDSSSAEYRALLSYDVDIAPLFERSCNHCHSPAVADSLRGFYLTGSYSLLFAYGSDSTLDTRHRNLIPVDSICALITKTRQLGDRTGKCALRSPLRPLESLLITDWVVNYYAREE